MKKETLVLSLLAIFGVTTLATFAAVDTGSDIMRIDGLSGTDYGISFNAGKNKFHNGTGLTKYDGDAVVTTNLGNEIGFSYYQLMGGASTWHVLASGGYFYNTDPIHGVTGISIASKTDNVEYTIYYSRDNSFDHSQVLVSSKSTVEEFYFDDYQPSYFKIVNTGSSNLNFSAIDVSFSCANNSPVLTLESQNEEMGTVSGSGVKTAGDNVTITATPKAGYRFTGWYSESDLVSSEASYTFEMPALDLTYTAHFAYHSYNLLVSSESETKGTVSDSSGTYDYRTPITLTAYPNPGYSFLGWYEGSTLVSSSNPYAFTMPAGSKTYVGKFSANYYSLSLTNDNPSLGSVTGSGSFRYGNNVTVTATPHTGVSFLGWYNASDELVSSLATYSFAMPHENVQLTAKFAWTPYAMSLSVNNEAMGTVTGDGSYIYQQEVTLMATPKSGYSFFGWYDGEALVSQEATLVFAMPSNSLNYEAVFVKNYTISIYPDAEGKGVLTGPTECGAGLTVTVTANPNVGYALDYWCDEDFNEVSTEESYTFTMPENDVVLYAVFCTGYTFSLSTSDSLKGTVSSGGQIKAGRTAVASMNYIKGTFKGWFDEGGNLVSTENPYVFTMPADDVSLIATFMTDEEEAAAEAIRQWNIAHGVIPTLSADGKTLTYGLYPNTHVSYKKEAALISALNALSATESNGWYLYEGEYYAKVENGYSDRTFSDGEKDSYMHTNYFRCEPITWKVLARDGDDFTLLSSALLDQMHYQESVSAFAPSSTMYYENSIIRSWLNGEFYSSAFALDDSHILTTTVDNSASTTAVSNNRYASTTPTQDKVFLPSYADYLNANYGFSTSTNTDYSRAAYYGDYILTKVHTDRADKSSDYWTRSPGDSGSILHGVSYVSAGSGVLATCYYDRDGLCVRPAIRLHM